MGEVCRVSWIKWAGVSKKRHLAFFNNKTAAENFIKGLSEDKKVEDIELTEGLSIRDVQPV